MSATHDPRRVFALIVHMKHGRKRPEIFSFNRFAATRRPFAFANDALARAPVKGSRPKTGAPVLVIEVKINALVCARFHFLSLLLDYARGISVDQYLDRLADAATYGRNRMNTYRQKQNLVARYAVNLNGGATFNRVV